MALLCLMAAAMAPQAVGQTRAARLASRDGEAPGAVARPSGAADSLLARAIDKGLRSEEAPVFCGTNRGGVVVQVSTPFLRVARRAFAVHARGSAFSPDSLQPDDTEPRFIVAVRPGDARDLLQDLAGVDLRIPGKGSVEPVASRVERQIYAASGAAPRHGRTGRFLFEPASYLRALERGGWLVIRRTGGREIDAPLPPVAGPDGHPVGSSVCN